jgi:hypothetical protein
VGTGGKKGQRKRMVGKVIGVRRDGGRWSARYKKKHLGMFSSQEEAADAYMSARGLDPKGQRLVTGEDYKVDEAFRKEVSGIMWHFCNKGYLFSTRNGSMHRMVWSLAGMPDPLEGQVLDHINHNKSDNRIENLRLITARGNNLHRARRSLGVQKCSANRWRVRVGQKSYGLFDDEETARLAARHLREKEIESEVIMYGKDNK